jgi:hypothetical protein
MMLLSDSVGGADESMNGFSNLMPVNSTDVSTPISSSAVSQQSAISTVSIPHSVFSQQSASAVVFNSSS